MSNVVTLDNYRKQTSMTEILERHEFKNEDSELEIKMKEVEAVMKRAVQPEIKI